MSHFPKFFYLYINSFSFVDDEDSAFLLFLREAWVDFELVGDDLSDGLGRNLSLPQEATLVLP